mmetsp:Transcript_18070/g.30833  ORF Transcript_18070/g.30833 Transcript_18070/m.30833 type:complete len:147 (+) Transcript_18070:12-452(+)
MIEDPIELQKKHQMSKYIAEMPPELQDRFKGLKVVADDLADFDGELEEQMRKTDILFEQLYGDVFKKRAEVVCPQITETLPSFFEDLVLEFDEKYAELKSDPDFEKLEIEEADLKDTLKTNEQMGVANFWLRAMLNHPNICLNISE